MIRVSGHKRRYNHFGQLPAGFDRLFILLYLHQARFDSKCFQKVSQQIKSYVFELYHKTHWGASAALFKSTLCVFVFAKGAFICKKYSDKKIRNHLIDSFCAYL